MKLVSNRFSGSIANRMPFFSAWSAATRKFLAASSRSALRCSGVACHWRPTAAYSGPTTIVPPICAVPSMQ